MFHMVFNSNHNGLVHLVADNLTHTAGFSQISFHDCFSYGHYLEALACSVIAWILAIFLRTSLDSSVCPIDLLVLKSQIEKFFLSSY